MPKFVNNAEEMMRESLEGFAAAHRDLIRLHENPFFIRRRHAPVPGKPALVSGGGSGHEPLHIGFVGRGMLDAACPGEIFTSPTPDQIVTAAKAVDGGAGLLFIVKNYAGDRMNFDMASERLTLPHALLVVRDEVIPGDYEGRPTARRGMAGTLLIEKMVGAAAEAGADLAACLALGERIAGAVRTMGVALSGCVLPGAAKPTFTLAAGEMEVGVGIHGEPGRKKRARQTAEAIVAPMVDDICGDLGARPGDRVLLHINGLGATPLVELYLVFHAAETCCRAKGLRIERCLVGNYTTSLEMAGCSITLMRLDDELVGLWDAPVCTPALRWGL